MTSTLGYKSSQVEDEANEVAAEQALGVAGQHMAMSNYSEKLIEQKERELRESIAANYNRMRGVERELSQLQLQLKLTAGPKKMALEMYRRKIETQNERVAAVRQKHINTKKVLDALEAELQREEALKETLCNELNTLVQQSAVVQLAKLDELKAHLEALTRGVAVPTNTTAAQSSTQQPSTNSSTTGQASETASSASAGTGSLQNGSSACKAIEHADCANPFLAPSPGRCTDSQAASPPSHAVNVQSNAAPITAESGSLKASSSRHSLTSGDQAAAAGERQTGQQASPGEARQSTAAASEARSRHVGLKAKGTGGKSSTPPESGIRATKEQSKSSTAVPQQQSERPGNFAGFDT